MITPYLHFLKRITRVLMNKNNAVLNAKNAKSLESIKPFEKLSK